MGVERLDFPYLRSGDVAADMARFVEGFGARISFAGAVAAGWTLDAELDIPPGPCATLRSPGGPRVAVYVATRPGVTDRFIWRRDF